MSNPKQVVNDPVVRATLEAAGWYEGRDVGVTDWVRKLTGHGIAAFPSAVAVLREFGGLRIKPPFIQGATFLSTDINFDPVWAADGSWDGPLDWSKDLGKKLFPIGEWEEQFMLLAAEDGTIYADVEGEFSLIGEDIYQALRLMVLREKHPEVVINYRLPPTSAT
jgi:hypothetical protein